MKQPEQVLPDVDAAWCDDTVVELHGFCGGGDGPRSNLTQQVLYVSVLSESTAERGLTVAVRNYDGRCSRNLGSQLDGGGDGDGDGTEVEDDAVIFHQTEAPDMSADTEKDYYKRTNYELGTATECVMEEWAHLRPGKRSSVDLNILTTVLILAPG